MALTVSTLRKYASGTAGNGTWLRIDLPPYTHSVQIEVDGNAWVDGPGGGYTDGAGRSSGGRPTTSGETVVLPIVPSADGAAVYVAGNGASRSVTIYPAGREAR